MSFIGNAEILSVEQSRAKLASIKTGFMRPSTVIRFPIGNADPDFMGSVSSEKSSLLAFSYLYRINATYSELRSNEIPFAVCLKYKIIKEEEGEE